MFCRKFLAFAPPLRALSCCGSSLLGIDYLLSFPSVCFLCFLWRVSGVFFFFFLSPKLRVLQLVFWVGMFMWSRFKDKPCLPCDVDNNKEEYVVDLITPISGGSAVWRWNWQWLLIPVLGFHQVQWWCPWLTPFFFCWNFVLLPFHNYSGNEADDDLMMKNILPSIVYCSRCRISNDWMLYFKACPGVYDDLWYGGTSSGVAWRLHSLCDWLMFSKVGGCRTKYRVYSRRSGCLLS